MLARPLATLLALAPLLAVAPALAATFVVDTTADGGDLDLSDLQCDDGSGACPLRAAIEQANSTASIEDRIEFAIPGDGPHTIETRYPYRLAVMSPLTIDGTTQPGASANTADPGSNAVLMIETVEGLTVDAPDVELRGLVIHGGVLFGGVFLPDFAGSTGSRLRGSRVRSVVVDGSGVQIGGLFRDSRNVIEAGIDIAGDDNFVVNNLIGVDPSGTQASGFGYDHTGVLLLGSRNTLTDNVISGFSYGVSIVGSSQNVLARNLIGTNAAGTAEIGNGAVGVRIVDGSANRIGWPSATLAQANVIAGNRGPGVHVRGGGGNLVQGNWIGTRIGGLVGIPNDHEGILIEGSDGNTIGTPGFAAPDGEGNVIAFNRLSGVTVKRDVFSPLVATIDNSIRGNRIWRNGFGFGGTIDIDLGGDGFDGPGGGEIDADEDEGANHLQNPPDSHTVTASQGRTQISGSIRAATGSYALDFYSSVACGSGHGQFYLGRTVIAAFPAAPGQGSIDTPFSADLAVTASGRSFSATATDLQGNTSEFSECFEVPVFAGADLSLLIDADPPGAVDAGDPVVFTLTLANQGPFEATDVPVRVQKPAGFTSWLAAPSQGGYDETTGLWSAGTLANGATVSLVITAVVDPARVQSIQVNAAAFEGLAQLDPNLFDNDDQELVTVRSGADLALSQTAPASAEPGEEVRFDPTVTNMGPERAVGVTLRGQLAAGLDFVAGPPPPFAFDPATRRWAYPIGDLAEDVSTALQIDARIAGDASLGTGLAHSVSAFAVPPRDPTDANNLSTVTVGVGRAADLEIVSFTLEGEPLIVGEEELDKWLLTIRNNGPDGVERFSLSLGCSSKVQMLPPAPVAVASTCVLGPVLEAQGVCPLVCDLELPLAADEEAPIEIAMGPEGQLAAEVGPSTDEPYYETDPEASTLAVRPSVAPLEWCGDDANEALLLLPLLAVMRRRRARRAAAWVLALATPLLAPAPTRALPIGFAVDSAASSGSVAITSPISTSPESVGVSGTADADLVLVGDALFGLVADSLQLTGAALAFSDATLVLASPPLSTITFTSAGLGASLTGPLAGGFPVAPGLSLFSLAGSVLRFDTGVIQALGQSFGVPIDVTLDLAQLSIASPFPSSAVAEARVTDLGGGLAEIELSFPFSAPVRVATGSAITTVTFAGELTLRGNVVPEPSTAVLVGGGALLLGVARRRRPVELRACARG